MTTKSKILTIITSLFIGLAIIFLLGPRVKIDTSLQAIDLPEDLDAYLARKEGRYHDIVPGAEKSIVWAGERGQKTGVWIVL